MDCGLSLETFTRSGGDLLFHSMTIRALSCTSQAYRTKRLNESRPFCYSHFGNAAKNKSREKLSKWCNPNCNTCSTEESITCTILRVSISTTVSQLLSGDRKNGFSRICGFPSLSPQEGAIWISLLDTVSFPYETNPTAFWLHLSRRLHSILQRNIDLQRSLSLGECKVSLLLKQMFLPSHRKPVTRMALVKKFPRHAARDDVSYRYYFESVNLL